MTTFNHQEVAGTYKKTIDKKPYTIIATVENDSVHYDVDKVVVLSRKIGSWDYSVSVSDTIEVKILSAIITAMTPSTEYKCRYQLRHDILPVLNVGYKRNYMYMYTPKARWPEIDAPDKFNDGLLVDLMRADKLEWAIKQYEKTIENLLSMD